MWNKIRVYAKFIAAIIGMVAASFNAFIPSEYQSWVAAVIALLTAISVYAIPNLVEDTEQTQ
jgi:putative Mn2+ efflux pump MntP